jgi:Zn-dependent protease
MLATLGDFMRKLWLARLTIARVENVPIQIHWTAPIGLFVFGQLRIVPAFWAGLFLLILLHELGHAAVVRACRFRVTGILLHGAGGLCFWTGDATPLQRSLIAWGGVWVQLVLLALATVAQALWWRTWPRWAFELASAFTIVNFLLIVLNLLPIAFLDGVRAWPLFPRLYRRWRLRRLRELSRQVRADAAALDALDQAEAPPEVQQMIEDVLQKARRGGGPH